MNDYTFKTTGITGNITVNADGEIKRCACCTGATDGTTGDYLYLDPMCPSYSCTHTNRLHKRVLASDYVNGTTSGSTWLDIYNITNPACAAISIARECYKLCSFEDADCNFEDYRDYTGIGTPIASFGECEPCDCCDTVMVKTPCKDAFDYSAPGATNTCVECGAEWSWSSNHYGVMTINLTEAFMAWQESLDPNYCRPSGGISERRYQIASFNGYVTCEWVTVGILSELIAHQTQNHTEWFQAYWNDYNYGPPENWCRYITLHSDYDEPNQEIALPVCVKQDLGGGGTVDYSALAGGFLNNPSLIDALTPGITACSGTVTESNSSVHETWDWTITQNPKSCTIEIALTSLNYSSVNGVNTHSSTQTIQWAYSWQTSTQRPCGPNYGC